MISKEERVRLQWAWRHQPETFASAHLKILTTQDGWKPLRFWPEQKKLLDTVQYIEHLGRPVRIVTLKSRKRGLTTGTLALCYHKCCYEPDFRAYFTAQQQQTALDISRIAKGYADHINPAFQARFKPKVTDWDLSWKNGSSLHVGTARSTRAMRGVTTPRWIHMTEAAYYEVGGDDFVTGTLTSLESVPGTYAIVESTPNGAAGPYFDIWRLAEAGQSDFTPLFFSWKDAPALKFPDTPGDAESVEMVMRGAVTLPEWCLKHHVTEEWGKRLVKFSLTLSQTRWAIAKCATDFRGDLRAFDQEYPLDPIYAFIASGEHAIDQALIRDLLAWAPMYQVSGYLDSESGNTPGDCWEIFSEYDSTHHYTLGGDVGLGVGQDYSALSVRDCTTGKMAAFFYDNMTTPEELGRQAARAGWRYGHAPLVIEQNNHGHVVHRVLLDLGYGALYCANPPSGISPSVDSVALYGFRTDAGSRPGLFAEYLAAIREGYCPASKRVLGELQTLVVDEKKRVDHMPGRHSDGVVADALALFGESHYGLKARKSETERPLGDNEVYVGKNGFLSRTKPKNVRSLWGRNR